MSAPAQEWGVVLGGDLMDLNIWKENLPKGFDPWVDIVPLSDPMEYVLRSTSFDDLTTPTEVREAARNLAAMIGGTLLLQESVDPVVTTGTIIGFNEDGTINRHGVVQTLSTRIRIRSGSATVVLCVPNQLFRLFIRKPLYALQKLASFDVKRGNEVLKSMELRPVTVITKAEHPFRQSFNI